MERARHGVQEGVAVAERLCRTVHDTPLTSHDLTLSLSIAIAEFPNHGADLAALKKAADTATYVAKSLGRNLVRVLGEPPLTLA